MTTQTHEDLLKSRKDKLDSIKESGFSYPNDFRPNISIEAVAACSEYTENQINIYNDYLRSTSPLRVAGRIKLHRVMGKTSFAHISDHSGSLQLYLHISNNNDGVPQNEYDLFKKMDLGDIVGVEGYLYRTQKGELSVKVIHMRLLAKSLRPLPDKHHGLVDQEARYRQRYLDLIANPSSVEIFKARSKIISKIRQFMEKNDFIEVETPMMHPIPGGATARPFITHHNALDMDLYLRIAPELYLKRLIVGGFTKVFEINRNFRNEGLSPRHNPEFSMMEFYWAYSDYNDLMDFTESLLKEVALSFTENKINFSNPFIRMTMKESVLKYYNGITKEDLSKDSSATKWVQNNVDKERKSTTVGELISYLFEQYVESKLIEPTFITEFPVEISPLARRNNLNTSVADRFELYISGQEIANGFSELNDSEDQADRFRLQAKEKDGGNLEAMHYDDDYIQALEYGMAPTAGEGIGIDRLVMLMLGQSNIRDVILFPQMRNK